MLTDQTYLSQAKNKNRPPKKTVKNPTSAHTDFITDPYWTGILKYAQEAGCCIATFSQISDYYPVTKGNEKAALEDGTLVLLPMKSKVFATSPDKTNNSIPGIVFKQWQNGFGGVTVWFNEKDLTLTY